MLGRGMNSIWLPTLFVYGPHCWQSPMSLGQRTPGAISHKQKAHGVQIWPNRQTSSITDQAVQRQIFENTTTIN
jgi:hypothetical protein